MDPPPHPPRDLVGGWQGRAHGTHLTPLGPSVAGPDGIALAVVLMRPQHLGQGLSTLSFLIYKWEKV